MFREKNMRVFSTRLTPNVGTWYPLGNSWVAVIQIQTCAFFTRHQHKASLLMLLLKNYQYFTMLAFPKKTIKSQTRILVVRTQNGSFAIYLLLKVIIQIILGRVNCSTDSSALVFSQFPATTSNQSP